MGKGAAMAANESVVLRRRRTLLLVAAGVLALPVLATYLAQASGWFFRAARVDLAGPGGMLYYYSIWPYYQAARWVLRYTTVYLVTSLASLVLALAALFPLRGSWRRPILPLLLILAVGLFPLAYRYRPALAAAPGYCETVLTPLRFPDSVTRQAREAIEERWCDYTLLGWSMGQLYYQECCGNVVRYRVYDPLAGAGPWSVKELPSEWDHSVVPREELLARIRAPAVRPEGQEPIVRSTLLSGDGLASHDGRWTALVSTRSYGPQDVLVLEAE